MGVSAEDKNKAINYIRRLLSRRPYSFNEIKNRLVKQGFTPDIIEEVFRELEKEFSKEQLDKEVLESLYLGACRKGKGPNWLKKRAFLEGIPSDMIHLYIDEFDWEQPLIKCVEKAKRKYGENLRKIRQYIYASGFDESVWEKVLVMLKEG